jgi:hypothetical protein
MRYCIDKIVALVLLVGMSSTAIAEPLAAPGDMQFRTDLQLLADSGVIDIPLTTWPVSLGDVHRALANVNETDLNAATRDALARVRFRVSWELDYNAFDFVFGASAAAEPRVMRTFEDTPRAEGEGYLRLAWLGERLAFNLTGRYVSDPIDGDEFRPDDTYLGMALGNWMLTAGWQDRWYGPGWDGSLILSNNARPTPGVMLQRINSLPFESKWFRWIGPWSFTSFMGWLDDERAVHDALLFGVRGAFKPIPSLEIGLVRTAQWCGEDRPCDLSTFADLLIGNDNRGQNVAVEDEPGNQLGGLDLRWALPADIPIALYFQWVGEDGAPGNRIIGNWLRQAGAEHWGSIGTAGYRLHVEFADTAANDGAYGFGDELPNYAYEHAIYKTGYRYKSRVLGHSTDNDSLTYSLGATLVQSGGQTWTASLRYMEINRVGTQSSTHTISAIPLDAYDIQLTYDADTRYGRFYVGIAYTDQDYPDAGDGPADVSGFIQWRSR